MRLSLRFIVPLLAVLMLLAWLTVPLADRLTLRWFIRDLDARSELIVSTMQGPLDELLTTGNQESLAQFLSRVGQDQRIYALAWCPDNGGGLLATAALPPEISCNSLGRFSDQASRLVTTDQLTLLVSTELVSHNGVQTGTLILLHDMSFIARRSAETRRYFFWFFSGLAVVISLITVVVAQLSWRGWLRGIRALTRGEGIIRPSADTTIPELRPIARDIRSLIAELETEHRSRDSDQIAWSAESLRRVLERDLPGQEVMVVSNREPYIHMHTTDGLQVWQPASGLVTALEPVMRACSGTWIAHGGGSADREVVDRNDRVAVPPEEPAYRLRRVWMSEEEEAGYYYGFSNEGLWPLCHNAHVRPSFRVEDWAQYVKINHRFARAVVDEARTRDPVVLVQDYHFALLPRMVRELLPDATIIAFWHIPWPNPEAFGICPWREELLDGMLGSTIMGFHTGFHSNNFLDTVERYLEARVDRELSTVSYRKRTTTVARYPISVDWPPLPSLLANPVQQCRAEIRHRHQLPAEQAIGVGVDRLDYTKGVEERFRAVERFLERHPEWVGRFTFIQLAAPTRASIGDYQDYAARVEGLAAQINQRFAVAGHPAIILKIAHHRPPEIYTYYRAAEFAFVSSLHDGMNLVAKEFVSARDDERGVLILSQFTGASRELPEALIVNPYDTEQCATAIWMALDMHPGEQRARMRLMRGLIQEFNVYRWAGRMLLDAARTRRRSRFLDHEPGSDGAVPRQLDRRSRTDSAPQGEE